jgi:vesicle-fusing ATPase
LLVLLRKSPPDEGRRLLVIGSTTSCPHLLEDFGSVQAFGVSQLVGRSKGCDRSLESVGLMNEKEARGIAKAIINKPIGIKQLVMVAEMAKQGSGGVVDVNVFMECLHGMSSYCRLLINNT